MEVYIRNFRSFQDFNTKLKGNLISIIGPNNAGKSNFLRAIKKVADNSLTTEDIRIGSTETHVLIKYGEKAYEKSIKLNDINSIVGVVKDDNLPVLYLPSPLETKEVERFRQRLNSFIYHSIDPSLSKSVGEWIETFNKKIITAQKLGGMLTDIEITPQFSINMELMLGEKGMRFEQLGSGSQRLVLLEMLLLWAQIEETQKYIILIEEPELHLDFKMQRKVARMLEEVSKNHTIILTTHSPIFAIGEVHLFYNDGETKEISFSDRVARRLLGISLRDIWMGEGILAVEGKTDQTIVKHLLERYFPNRKIGVIAIGGGDNVHMVGDIKRLGIPMVYLFDGDKRNKADIVWPKGKSIENMFTKEAIKEVLGIEIGDVEDVKKAIINEMRAKNPKWKYSERVALKIINRMIERGETGPIVEVLEKAISKLSEG